MKQPLRQKETKERREQRLFLRVQSKIEDEMLGGMPYKQFRAHALAKLIKVYKVCLELDPTFDLKKHLDPTHYNTNFSRLVRTAYRHRCAVRSEGGDCSLSQSYREVRLRLLGSQLRLAISLHSPYGSRGWEWFCALALESVGSPFLKSFQKKAGAIPWNHTGTTQVIYLSRFLVPIPTLK